MSQQVQLNSNTTTNTNPSTKQKKAFTRNPYLLHTPLTKKVNEADYIVDFVIQGGSLPVEEMIFDQGAWVLRHPERYFFTIDSLRLRNFPRLDALDTCRLPEAPPLETHPGLHILFLGNLWYKLSNSAVIALVHAATGVKPEGIQEHLDKTRRNSGSYWISVPAMCSHHVLQVLHERLLLHQEGALLATNDAERRYLMTLVACHHKAFQGLPVSPMTAVAANSSTIAKFPARRRSN